MIAESIKWFCLIINKVNDRCEDIDKIDCVNDYVDFHFILIRLDTAPLIPQSIS